MRTEKRWGWAALPATGVAKNGAFRPAPSMSLPNPTSLLIPFAFPSRSPPKRTLARIRSSPRPRAVEGLWSAFHMAWPAGTQCCRGGHHAHPRRPVSLSEDRPPTPNLNRTPLLPHPFRLPLPVPSPLPIPFPVQEQGGPLPSSTGAGRATAQAIKRHCPSNKAEGQGHRILARGPCSLF